MLSQLVASFHRDLVLMGAVYLLFALAIAMAVCFAAYFLVRMLVKLIRFRGRRAVVCPETGSTAFIRIDALHAAVSSAIGDPELQVRDCSRWPERKACHQECLAGIRM
jgi:hypothetical protein